MLFLFKIGVNGKANCWNDARLIWMRQVMPEERRIGILRLATGTGIHGMSRIGDFLSDGAHLCLAASQMLRLSELCLWDVRG